MSVKHTIQTEDGAKDVSLTPMLAIKHYCRNCMGYVIAEVERCTSKSCPLYPFRTGDAHSGKVVSGENRERVRKMATALQIARKNARSGGEQGQDKGAEKPDL